MSHSGMSTTKHTCSHSTRTHTYPLAMATTQLWLEDGLDVQLNGAAPLKEMAPS